MSGIILNTSFDNDNLPVSAKLSDRIKAIDSLVAWFQADSEHVTLASSEIATWTDKAGGAGVLTAVSASNRAVLTSGAISSYSAASFKGTPLNPSAVAMYLLSGASFPTTSPYSFAVVFNPADAANGDTVLGRFTDVSTRMILNIETGATSVNFSHGTSTYLRHPISSGTWCYVIGSFDGTNLRMYADGISYGAVAAAGTSGTANFLVGALTPVGSQAFDGSISDVMLFSDDIISDADQLAAVVEYITAVYGL